MKRGRMPICRRCRKEPATVNAWCDACYVEMTREAQRLADAAAYDRCHRRKGCAAQVAADCRDLNEHAHHRKLRSQGGPTTDENLLNVCRPCHQWIHDNPEVSYAKGLLVPSWADPATFTGLV